MIPIDDHGELRLDSLDAIARRGQRQGRREQPGSRTRSARSTPSSSSPSGRTSTARSWSSTQRRRRRTGRSTCRRSAATSSRSPRTRCAARPRSARSGDARAARRDVAVQPRRRHDPLGALRGDDLGRAAVQVRGRARSRSPRRTAFGAAIDYISAIGLDAIEQHEHELVAYAMEQLSEIDGRHGLRPAARPARRHRLVQPRERPPARRLAGARLGERRRSAAATTARSR